MGANRLFWKKKPSDFRLSQQNTMNPRDDDVCTIFNYIWCSWNKHLHIMTRPKFQWSWKTTTLLTKSYHPGHPEWKVLNSTCTKLQNLMLPPQLAKSHLPNLSQDVGIRTTCRNGLMLHRWCTSILRIGEAIGMVKKTPQNFMGSSGYQECFFWQVNFQKFTHHSSYLAICSVFV